MLIFDTPNNITSKIPALLKIAPKITVIRYIAPGSANAWKVITPTEARAIASYNGAVQLGLVYETNGRPRGSAVGEADGRAAQAAIQALGAPPGAFVAYTSDEDAPSNINALGDAFQAFFGQLKSPEGKPLVHRVCYGAGATCDYLVKRGLIDPTGRWITQSLGFSGTRQDIAAGDWDLRQLLPSTLAGLDADKNLQRVDTQDLGFFVPWGGVAKTPPLVMSPVVYPSTATPEDVEALQTLLNSQGFHLLVDGIYGKLTTDAVEEFQKSRGLAVDGIAGSITVGALRTPNTKPA